MMNRSRTISSSASNFSTPLPSTLRGGGGGQGGATTASVGFPDENAMIMTDWKHHHANNNAQHDKAATTSKINVGRRALVDISNRHRPADSNYDATANKGKTNIVHNEAKVVVKSYPKTPTLARRPQQQQDPAKLPSKSSDPLKSAHSNQKKAKHSIHRSTQTSHNLGKSLRAKKVVTFDAAEPVSIPPAEVLQTLLSQSISWQGDETTIEMPAGRLWAEQIAHAASISNKDYMDDSDDDLSLPGASTVEADLQATLLAMSASRQEKMVQDWERCQREASEQLERLMATACLRDDDFDKDLCPTIPVPTAVMMDLSGALDDLMENLSDDDGSWKVTDISF